MKTYRVAIVGLGRMAGTIDEEMPEVPPATQPYSIAASCHASDRLELVAGADIQPEKRAAFRDKWGVDALYEDYIEMVEKERPDLVAVCTTASGLPRWESKRAPSADFSVDLHAEITTRLAEAGVPMLYVEKAMACSMRAADAVLEACHKHGTVFNIGVLKRFDTRWRQARALIEGGEIGQPKAGVHYASTNLMHSHIHSIDAFSYLVGDPGIVAVRGELLPRGVEIRDNRMLEDYIATYQIAFANGVDAWNVPAGHWELEVIGETGAVRVVNNGMRVSLRKMGSPEDPSPQGVLQHTPWYPLPEWEEVSVPSVEPNSPVVTCLEDLLDAHESGRPSIANVDVTHSITEACIAVAESHQRGGAWVELPLENRDLYAFHA